MNKLITFKSVTVPNRISETSFSFDSGVMCLVTTKEHTERIFFSVIAGEILPEYGEIENGFASTSLSTGKLPPEIKVKDYIKFVKKAKKCAELPEITNTLTEGLEDMRIRSLSPFSKLKLSVAAAMINEPELLLIASPAKELEPSDIKKLGSLIDSLREYTNIIFSCNIPSVFGEHSDKLLVISDGKFLGFGDTAEIFALSEKDGGLIARIKGDIDAASGFLTAESYSLEKTEKPGIFYIRCTDSDQARKEIRAVVRKLGMAILEMKADNDILKDMFALLENEEEKHATEYEDSDEDATGDEDITEEQADDEKANPTEENDVTRPKKTSITIAFAHNDEEDE